MSDWNIGHSASWYEPIDEPEWDLQEETRFVAVWDGEEIEDFATEKEAIEYMMEADTPEEWKIETKIVEIWVEPDVWARDWDD